MKRQKSGVFGKPTLTTLRSYAKYRILNDMIENAKKHAMYSKNYMLMIVDE